MEGLKTYFARNKAWLISASFAVVGYTALQALKASNIYDVNSNDVPIYVWTPLAVTVIAVLITLAIVLFSKTKTAKAFKVILLLGFVCMVFKYTIGFVFNL